MNNLILTPEIIKGLKDGAEMDALVAQFVMGWKWTDNPDWFTRNNDVLIWMHPKSGCLRSEPYHNQFAPITTQYAHQWYNFEPSGCIRTAWDVVAKMISYMGPGCFSLRDGQEEEWCDNAYFWECGMYNIHIIDQPVVVRDITAPLAICRAALYACLDTSTLSENQTKTKESANEK